MPKVKSAGLKRTRQTKRNPKARLMREVSFSSFSLMTLMAPLAKLFSNWRLGLASATGIVALVLVGIFTAELTRPTADYLRDSFFTPPLPPACKSLTSPWKAAAAPCVKTCWRLRKSMPECQFYASIWTPCRPASKNCPGSIM